MEIKLNEEMFYGLLQGKKLEYVQHEGDGISKKWTIYPPHYGLYMTHAQLDEIRRQAYREGSTRMIELMDALNGKTSP